MASAQKRPKVGVFKDDAMPGLRHSMTASIHTAVSTRPHTMAPVKRVAPPLSRKRSREEDTAVHRLAKQARRDSTVAAQIERSSRLLTSTPLAVPKAPPMDMGLIAIPRPPRIRFDMQKVREYAASAAADATAAQEKLHAGTAATRLDPPPVKATNCGYPPPKAVATSPTPSENVISEPAAASQDPHQVEKAATFAEAPSPPAESTAEAQKLAELTQQNEVLKKELEVESETARSKSGQVLRLIKAHTEQKNELGSQIKALHEQLDDKQEALDREKAEYNKLQNKLAALEEASSAEVARLESGIAQLKEERKDAISEAQSAQAEVTRLNDRNTYLQNSARNAADAELKAGNKYTELQVQNKQAREDLQAAEDDRDQADQELVAAKECAVKMKRINLALVKALEVHGFDVGEAAHKVNASVDMDFEDDVQEPIPWNTLVKSNALYKPLVKPSLLFGIGTEPGGFGKTPLTETGSTQAEQRTEPKGAKGAVAQPSGPSSQTTTSFGMPSMVPAAQPQQGNSAPDHHQEDLERSLIQLSRELAETKQLSSELQAWAAKKDGNEQSAVPINLNQRSFQNYVNNVVVDAMANRMVASSGEAPTFGDDAGMSDAPGTGSSILSTAYVDFANAQTYGPDGWPMQTDDHTYAKSVSRQNQNATIERGGKKKNNDVRNKQHGYAPYDPAAGKRNGLDIDMGNSEHYKSFEEGLFSSSKKRKHDGDHGGSNKSRGKDNNRSKNNRGRGANNNRGKGGFSGNNDPNGNQSRGGRGGRGRGLGGRGGRGGRGSFDDDDDTLAGAAAESPLDNGDDGDQMLALSSIPLGTHQTSLLQDDDGNTFNEGGHLIAKAPIVEEDDLSDNDEIMVRDSLRDHQPKWTKKQKMLGAPPAKSFSPGFNPDKRTPKTNGRGSSIPRPKYSTPRSSTPQGLVPSGPRAPSKMPRHSQPSGLPPQRPRSNHANTPVSQHPGPSDPEEHATLAALNAIIKEGKQQGKANHYGDDRAANEIHRRAAKEQQRQKR